MTLKQYVALMSAITALCWFGWGAIVWNVDPFAAGLFGLALFYCTLALALIGTFSVIGLLIRSRTRREGPIGPHVASSFRQGVLLSALCIACLMLQSLGRLSWATLILTVGAAAAVEYFLLTFRKRGA